VVDVIVPAYLRALERAEMVAAAPRIKGVPIWRSAGIESVRLVVRRFLDLVRTHEVPAVFEHGGVVSAAANRAVFGDRQNVYELLDLPDRPDVALRSDNMSSTVPWLAAGDRSEPAVSVGGVARTASGSTPPLFRDRSVWPVVELNQLSTPEQAPVLLRRHAATLETLLDELAIPALTVETPELADYGRLSYLTVTALPERRPTVLATLYVIAAALRDELGASGDVLDVGFTGKVMAVMAMLHLDRHGLLTPSAAASIQVGIVLDAADPDGVAAGTDLQERLRSAGVRAACSTATSAAGARRAQLAWLRRGAPVVVGPGTEPGAVTVWSRLPTKRVAMTTPVDVEDLRDMLARSDARLRTRAEHVFDTTMAEGGHLRFLCARCVEADAFPVFGTIVPQRFGDCAHCGESRATLRFLSEEGRFY
jgi:hypothetical protein